MELRVIGRGALAGLCAGILGFVFARLFAEPFINKAIAYESGRDDALKALNTAAGRPVAPDGPEVFSRHIQSTVGIATGIIGFSIAMGALVAVVYLVMHGRFKVSPQKTIWLIAAAGFLGIYALPFVKYPANPPAIGHSFTISDRGHLYLLMVLSSVLLLGVAFYVVRRLLPRFGMYRSVLLAGAGFFVLYGTLIGALPSLGNLPLNKQHVTDFGYARATTETPQPITNIRSKPIVVDGKTIEPGQIVYPGFDADVLWKFRWYSLLDQMLIWTTVGMTFGALCERYVLGPAATRVKADRTAWSATV